MVGRPVGSVMKSTLLARKRSRSRATPNTTYMFRISSRAAISSSSVIASVSFEKSARAASLAKKASVSSSFALYSVRRRRQTVPNTGALRVGLSGPPS
jgi:hypothetical protein